MKIRYQGPTSAKKRKKVVNVPAGKSIRGVDFNGESEDEAGDSTEAGQNSRSREPTPAVQSQEDIFKNATPQDGVSKVTQTEVLVNTWVIVNFKPGSGSVPKKKWNCYVGNVETILPRNEF